PEHLGGSGRGAGKPGPPELRLADHGRGALLQSDPVQLRRARAAGARVLPRGRLLRHRWVRVSRYSFPGARGPVLLLALLPGLVGTGAAAGFGAAIARHLAERGFRVFGTVRRAEDEVALARDGVTPVRMDVTDTASIMRARGEVERALGTAPLMALVNNAGIPAAGPLELFPLDELRQILEVNLIGAVAVTQAFLALLKASRGRIVNISSVAGRGALPFLGPYAASKFGLEAISDSLRREL